MPRLDFGLSPIFPRKAIPKTSGWFSPTDVSALNLSTESIIHNGVNRFFPAFTDQFNQLRDDKSESGESSTNSVVGKRLTPEYLNGSIKRSKSVPIPFLDIEVEEDLGLELSLLTRRSYSTSVIGSGVQNQIVDKETSAYPVGFGLYVGGLKSRYSPELSEGYRIEYYESQDTPKRLRADSWDEIFGSEVSKQTESVETRVHCFPFQDDFLKSHSDTADLLQDQVRIFSHFARSYEVARKAILTNKSVHFMCYAGKSRSAIMAAASIYLANREELLLGEPILDMLNSRISNQMSYCQKVENLVEYMSRSQLDAGRSETAVLYPNGWFRFQLATLMWYFDHSDLGSNEAKVAFRKICSDFYEQYVTKMQIRHDISDCHISTFYSSSVKNYLGNVLSDPEKLNHFYVSLVDDISSHFSKELVLV